SVLGKAGEHDTEMHAILLQYDFQPDFPAEVEAEAAQISSKITAKEIASRRDMREVTTFTIDPTDAKDFDDALSLRVLENGRYEVGVHIADVSYYVKPGTALDREAFQRATSVYLVDRTVPMLPEKLSNEVCSLRPQEESLTYSVIFEMDEDARVHKYWIGRTVIFSDHRFDYDGAQDVLEGKAEGPFATELKTLHQLAQKLRERRFAKGSIEFESEEVKFVLDEHDKPVGVVRKVMKDANHLIEDFMLLANRTVATHIFKLKDNPPLPSVYRIHDRPDPEKLANLAEFVGKLGHRVDFEAKGDLSTRLNQLLKEVEGKPEQHVVSTIAVRAMAKAVYSTKNVGHFGLGFPYYTHFTSPIRRYPDLMIHRLLTAYGNHEYRENQPVMEAQLKHCSDKERTATEAERASIRYKQVEFLSDKIGQAFEGLISGVIEAGFFVELEETLCEGFVPVARMDDDYYVFDADRYALIGKDTGQMLQIGNRVRVTITSTDMQRRQVEMALVEKLEGAPVGA
ncbi:MAG: ribonuclease R, partial [Bacteroidetes bacterium]